MAVVTRHRRADDLIATHRDEEELALHRDFRWNHNLWRAPTPKV